LKPLVITGIRQLDKALAELEPKVVKKILRKAMRPSMKPMLKQAKANAPVDTGAIKKAIRLKSAPRSRQTLGLDLQIGEQNYVGKTFVGAFHEFGTSKMEPRPFMRPAYDSHKSKARTNTMEAIKKLILDQADKK
jgi:HK97 gp10 family phage protein